MRKFRFFFLIIIASCTATLFAQKEPVKGLDAYIAKALKDWNAPGLALAIVKDDKVVYAKGYGVQKLGESTPVDEHTIFAIGSATKAMTAACLGMLVDEKKLNWDDRVTKYLKSFQLYDPYVTRELMVRDLLTHRSGLERGDLLWYDTPYSREEVLTRIRFLKPAWGFRARYGYQNIMFLAAGQIIPEVAGKSWDDFIRERLFVPLGMDETTTSTKQLPGKPNVATPHGYIDNKLQIIPWVNIDNIAPAGSVNSSVSDMAQWIMMNLNEGTFNGQKIVSKDVIKEIQTPQTVIRIDSLGQALRPSTHFSAYGFGWLLSDYLGRKIVQHDGAIHGMRARVMLVPEEKLGLVTLINSTRSLIQAGVAYRILDSYLGGKERDWSAEYLKITKDGEDKANAEEKKKKDERVKDTKPSLVQSKYVGTYKNEMYGDLSVKEENGKLVATMFPTLVGDLEHWQYDTYHVVWRDKTRGDDYVTFTLDAAGKVDLLKWDGFVDFKRGN
jgi:CubicO group peptidase (beta-lactamase class C family)